MRRTLDDHVRAVVLAVGRVRAATGRDVHLAGYSQGGMFAYQAAAYLGSEGVASVITFGSPVDIHQNLPAVSTAVAGRILQAARPLVEPTLSRIEGLPGVITSTAFKLVSARKEVGQLVDFVQKLHDRQALVKREARRRFLGGEGFVAWPGPALRTFVDEFIVHNRMMSGGFVIDGRTVTLADLRSPVLYFVGTRDEIARPRAVRAIRKAAPGVPVFEVALPAGHFGLVVGGTANRSTWPTVLEWIHWREGQGPRPDLLPPEDGRARGDGSGRRRRVRERRHPGVARRRALLRRRRRGARLRLEQARRGRRRPGRERRRPPLPAPPAPPAARARGRHPDQRRPGPRRAGPRHPRAHLLPVEGPRLLVRGRRPPRRQRRARPPRLRRAPRRPGRRAHGGAAQLPHHGHRVQPPRRRLGADEPPPRRPRARRGPALAPLRFLVADPRDAARARAAFAGARAGARGWGGSRAGRPTSSTWRPSTPAPSWSPRGTAPTRVSPAIWPW